MLEKTDEEGYTKVKATFTTLKDGRNSWGVYRYCKPEFPLINDNIYKDTIEQYWKNKIVKFAYLNNCIGCFHRSPILLKHMSNKHPEKYQWFIDAEKDGYGARTFKMGMTYEQIRNSLTQTKLFDDDFNECDSGYCGV